MTHCHEGVTGSSEKGVGHCLGHQEGSLVEVALKHVLQVNTGFTDSEEDREGHSRQMGHHEDRLRHRDQQAA